MDDMDGRDPWEDRRLDTDMGDDEQADEIREYERYIEDPPSNLIIRDDDEQFPLTLKRELPQEWTRRRQRAEEAEEDDRPAEEAAIHLDEEQDEDENRD